MEQVDEKQLIREGLELLFNKSYEEFGAAVRERDSISASLASAEEKLKDAKARVDQLSQMIGIDYRSLPKDGLGVATSNAPPHLQSEARIVRRTRVRLEDDAETQTRRRGEWKNDVVRRLIAGLEGGGRATAANLYAALEAEGVSFEGIENPSHRLVQIMSADPRFDSNRAEGWGLKKENPAGTGFPATTSAEDTN